MGYRDDFLEINMYLQDLEDDETAELWVHCRDRSMLKFDGVRHNPVRYQGNWSIGHDFHGRRATSYIPADEVWYFTTVSKWDNRPEEPDDIYGVESTLLNGDPEVENVLDLSDPTVPSEVDREVAEVEADLYLTDVTDEVA